MGYEKRSTRIPKQRRFSETTLSGSFVTIKLRGQRVKELLRVSNLSTLQSQSDGFVHGHPRQISDEFIKAAAAWFNDNKDPIPDSNISFAEGRQSVQYIEASSHRNSDTSGTGINLASSAAEAARLKDGQRKVQFQLPWRRLEALPRPSLKLKLSNLNKPDTNGQPETPNPQSAVRTPTIKFRVANGGVSAVSTPGSKPAENDSPGSLAKKRKRDASGAGNAKPQAIRKISLNVNQPPSTKHVLNTPGIKLKTKGKIPKRPLGVGYDSELEEREADPVILEAFVLRMLPGDDCEYVRKAIKDGTIGVSRLQGGADIRVRFLDVHGRRGVLFVRGNQYAITLVDLPTVTEGMKSWDKKNFMKSVDVSQMCLVLGRCNSDEEARNYPLPPGVNPKNYQYAHGLTPPMHNVRKRRFERTARARVDDIEAIERKVNTLLKADGDATGSSYEILDYDPRQRRDGDSDEDASDSDADAEAEADDYFPHQPEADYAEEQHGHQFTDQDVAEFERMLEEGADDDEAMAAVTNQPASISTDAVGSPAVVSTDDGTGAATPAEPDDGGDEDEDDEGSDEEANQEQREGDEQRSQALERIREAENKIRQIQEQLRKATNAILKRKLALRIQDLQSDVNSMKRQAKLDVEDEGAEEDG